MSTTSKECDSVTSDEIDRLAGVLGAMKWDRPWDQFTRKVKQTWGELTDDDFDVAEGSYDELVGRIRSRTGQTEEAVREELHRL